MLGNITVHTTSWISRMRTFGTNTWEMWYQYVKLKFRNYEVSYKNAFQVCTYMHKWFHTVKHTHTHTHVHTHDNCP
jgi:hypothetical protein